jgi:autotransporter translocation and assembly factor TamB
VSRIDLAKLKALLGFGLDVSGTASLHVSGTDSFDVVVDAERLSMPAYDVALSRIQGKACVSRTRADFDHLWLVRQDSSAVPETSVVTGSVEYKTDSGFKLGTADLRARLRNPGAWVVFYLKSIMELRQGSIYGDVAVGGTLTRPMFDGRVRISRARLGVPIIGTSFDRVNAELVFDHSRINIEKLSGRSDHGNALVTGFVDVGQNWQVDSLRFHGDFSGTTINPMPEIYGTIGGSLDLEWLLGRPFSLSGTVNVEEALIAFGFGQSAGSGTGVPDTTLTYDVRVKGDRNIWFRNQLADIELGCDLTVRKTTRDVLYSGELTSRQGSIYYLDHTLRVDTGSVRFDNISTLNPEFYVTAGMPIRTALKEQGTPDTIVVALTGTLEKPSFAFRSAPPIWDETEILTYLTLNATQEQLQAMDQKNKVSALLSERLLGYFQTQVSKRARGFVNLDYLEFESSGLFDTSKQARVTVGKYVGRNLYVSYTQNLTGLMIPSFRVEYYINRKNEILAEGTPDDRYGYRTSLRYQLRLRY